MRRKVRVVFRRSDGLCLQNPRKPPCSAMPEQLSDERLIERQVIPLHGGQQSDYVVVEFDYPGKQSPWTLKWTPEGLVPAPEAPEETNKRRALSAVIGRICRRRLEQDLDLARGASDGEAVAYIEEELKRR